MADGVDRTLRFTADTPLGRHGLHVGPMAFRAAGIEGLLQTFWMRNQGCGHSRLGCGVRYFDVARTMGWAWLSVVSGAVLRVGRGMNSWFPPGRPPPPS